MPRALRIHFPGALFHVMTRGNAGQKIFLDRADYQAFLEILLSLKKQGPFLLYAYCLMTNHVHLLLEVNRFPLSLIMQRLLTRYSKHFNIRHKRLGHLFQGRYKAIFCQKDAYLQELIRYIHLNPVRAKLVKEPEAWRWSGHREYLGKKKGSLVDSRFPLSLFHPRLVISQELYAAFVRDGLGVGHNENYYPPQTLPCLGEETFVHEYRELVNRKEQGGNPPKKPVPLERLVALPKARVSLEMLRSKSQVRKITTARIDFIMRALKEGHRPSLIAAFLGCSPSAVSKIVNRNL